MAYNLRNHKTGDTFDGAEFTISLNASPLDLTGATIETIVKRGDCNGQVALTLSTATAGQMTITNASGGVFQIDEQIISLPAATYYYEIKFTLADSSVKTYISGTWTITNGLEC
jgi:hypothetical protein